MLHSAAAPIIAPHQHRLHEQQKQQGILLWHTREIIDKRRVRDSGCCWAVTPRETAVEGRFCE
jgi:hypothetical protein